MIKSILVAASLLFLSSQAGADSGILRVPMGYQQITSLSAATALTVPCDSSGRCPTLAVVTPEAQAVRYRDDGTDPSSTVGQPLAVAATLNYEGNLNAIKLIEQTSGAKVNVSYYR